MKKQMMVFSAMMMVLVLSFSVSAISGGKDTVVNGIVYDPSASVAVAGADVTVDCNGVVKTAVSDGSGAYAIGYSYSECPLGSTATVDAVKGSAYGSRTGTVSDFGLIVDLAIVNVPLVPEFGVVVGILTFISAIFMFFIVRRS